MCRPCCDGWHQHRAVRLTIILPSGFCNIGTVLSAATKLVLPPGEATVRADLSKTVRSVSHLQGWNAPVVTEHLEDHRLVSANPLFLAEDIQQKLFTLSGHISGSGKCIQPLCQRPELLGDILDYINGSQLCIGFAGIRSKNVLCQKIFQPLTG